MSDAIEAVRYRRDSPRARDVIYRRAAAKMTIERVHAASLRKREIKKKLSRLEKCEPSRERNRVSFGRTSFFFPGLFLCLVVVCAIVVGRGASLFRRECTYMSFISLCMCVPSLTTMRPFLSPYDVFPCYRKSLYKRKSVNEWT